MNTIYLQSAETTNPDFGGFRFFVEHGSEFDPHAYAEAYGLKPDEIDPDTIKSVIDAAARTAPNTWLEVTHEKS